MPLALKPWLQTSYTELQTALRLGRLPASVIISGDLRLESSLLALEIAKLYLCEDPVNGECCAKCHSCMQLSNPDLSHPDFLGVLSPTKESFDREEDLSHRACDLIANCEHAEATVLRIDTLRRFQEWIMQSSMGSRGKVAVIANAHLMPEAAANAILKTFEEPPAHTLIIMLTKSTDALLPTILSRAFKLYIHRPDYATALKELESLGVDTKFAPQALCLNGDAPKAAATMLKEGKIEKILDLIQSLSLALVNQGDPQAFIDKLFALEEKNAIFLAPERAAILEEFLLELLKYKAHVSLVKLPLLQECKVELLSKIKAQKIFAAKDALKFLRGGNNMTALRAPAIFMRSWIDSLKPEGN